jgi:hypothetical protein
VYVHLPESEDLVHENYVRPDREKDVEGEGKQYGRYYEERAEQNEEVFEEFMSELRKIVGKEKVIMCQQADDPRLQIVEEGKQI